MSAGGAERGRSLRVPGTGVRRWLVVLSGVLIAAGMYLAGIGSRRALWALLLAPVAFAPFAYARLRLHRALCGILSRSPRGCRAVALAGAGCDLIMIAQLLTARTADGGGWLNGPVVGWVGPVWFSAHVLLLLGYGLVGLLRLARRVGCWARSRVASGPVEETMPDIGRRQFLQGAGVLGAAAPFAISLSGVSLSYAFRVDEYEIHLPHWPAALDGLRVAHLSDIHVGGAMDCRRLHEIVALAAAARPDLVLHTGDFLTHRSGDFDAPLYEALARLRAPLGQWACLGNHDFDDPAGLVRKLAGAGVRVLRDRVAVIPVGGQALEIGGIDFLFGRADLAARYRAIFDRWPRRRGPRLVLNHDPRAFSMLPDGCADLVLSGHTHGGHIGIQLGNGHALTVVGLAGIPDQGLFQRGDLRLFVTRCVGFYGYPMRVGIPPEIALLVLRASRGSGAPAPT